MGKCQPLNRKKWQKLLITGLLAKTVKGHRWAMVEKIRLVHRVESVKIFSKRVLTIHNQDIFTCHRGNVPSERMDWICGWHSLSYMQARKELYKEQGLSDLCMSRKQKGWTSITHNHTLKEMQLFIHCSDSIIFYKKENQ